MPQRANRAGRRARRRGPLAWQGRHRIGLPQPGNSINLNSTIRAGGRRAVRREATTAGCGVRPIELAFDSLLKFDPNHGRIEFCGRRAILTHADAMGALRKELIATVGTEVAKVILTRYGFSSGYEDAGLLADFMHPETIEDFVLGGPRIHMFAGIAEVEPHIVEADRARRHYRMRGLWHRSYEAEQHLRLFGRADEAVCWTLAGYASGFASYVFQTDMICIEEECEGRGDPHCRWTLMNVGGEGGELAGLRRYFQPFDIKQQINLLESKVIERTRELEASEQRYRDLIEDLPEVVFALHASGRMVQLNKAGRTRLGVAPDSVSSLRLRDLVLPEFRQRAGQFLKQAAHRRRATKLDVVMRDARGRDFPVQIQVEPVLKNDKIVGYSGIAVDIGAHQARERKLSEYVSRVERREQKIQEIINEAVYILDREGRFAFVNERMADLLGTTAMAAAGMRCADLLPPGVAERVEEDFRRRLHGEASEAFEICLPVPSRTDVLLEINSVALVDDGRASAVIGVARDITARREMERQLAQAQRLAALGQFASGIAHEINNPLGLISGFAEEMQGLLDGAPAPGTPLDVDTLRRWLQTIQQQAHRCKLITENLLQFSSRQSVALEPLDVGGYLRERLADFREVGPLRALDIEFDLAPDTPLALASPMLLDQVLLNLLKNASDAMGGRGTIRVSVARAGSRVELEVADNGPGLPEGVIDHVFDPFFTTKAPGRGTGLGLSICYGIMAEMKGSIACGNRPEGGAWFRVALPLDPDSARRKSR